MAYKPLDWLGLLVEEEIRAALTWFKRTGTHPQVKKDPSTRFEDDGSNLRSQVDSPPLSDGHTVQIVKVLSIEDPLLLVSDGFTNVKALLTTGAITTLESEIGDPIDLGTKGDVFAVRRCTIVSTPYGPTEAQAQLIIDEIDYRYHLRKISGGAGTPIGERPEISGLLGEVMRIRHPEPAEQPNGATHSQNVRQRSRRSDQFETQAQPQSPASQASIGMASSSPVPVSQPPQTQPAAATQTGIRRRNPVPSMAQDGIEMVAGVNLERPTAAIPSRFLRKSPPSGPPKPAAISRTSAGLLNVLGKRKASEEVPPKSVDRNSTVSNRFPPPAPSPAASTVGKNAVDVTTVQPSSKSAQAEAGAALSEKEGAPTESSPKTTDKPYWRRRIPNAQKRLLDQQSSWSLALPGREFPRPNVPIEILTQWNKQAEQQPESVILSQTLPAQSQARAGNGSQAAAEDADEADSDTENTNDDVSDDEEVLPWSSSPAREALPSRNMTISADSRDHDRRDKPTGSNQSSPLGSSPPELSSSLLPTSTGNASRPSTAGRRPDLPPDSSFEHAVAPRALAQRKDNRNHSRPSKSRKAGTSSGIAAQRSIPTRPSPKRPVSQKSPHMLPPKPTLPQSPKGLFSPSNKADLSSHKKYRMVTQGSVIVRPSSAPNPNDPANGSSNQHADPVNGSLSSKSSSTSMHGAVADELNDAHFRHVSRSPVQGRMVPVVPISPSTVIKGTQMSRKGETDGLMEIEAARDIDPVLEHQKRRSKYMKGEQRRKWIKANYTPNPNKSFNLGTLLSAYKRAHPKDQLRLSELAEAYRDVFPDPLGDGGDDEDTIHVSAGTQNHSPTTSENVASTFSRPRVSTADTDDPDPTPSKSPTQPAAPELTELKRRSPGQVKLSGGEMIGSQSSRRDPGRGQDATIARISPLQVPDDRDVHGAMVTSTTGAEKRESVDMSPDPSRQPRRPTEQSERNVKTSSAHTKAAKRPMDPPPPSATASAAHKKRAAPDHHVWFVKRIENDQRKLKKEMLPSKDREKVIPGPSFGEFAAVWRGSGPGGAFAKTRDDGREGEVGKRRGTRLDVLGWEL